MKQWKHNFLTVRREDQQFWWVLVGGLNSCITGRIIFFSWLNSRRGGLGTYLFIFAFTSTLLCKAEACSAHGYFLYFVFVRHHSKYRMWKLLENQMWRTLCIPIRYRYDNVVKFVCTEFGTNRIRERMIWMWHTIHEVGG